MLWQHYDDWIWCFATLSSYIQQTKNDWKLWWLDILICDGDDDDGDGPTSRRQCVDAQAVYSAEIDKKSHPQNRHLVARPS